MKASKIVSRSVLVALGLTTASVALANPPHGASSRDRNNGYSRNEGFARVVDVDPIVRRVRVSSPQEQCWNEERPVVSSPTRTEVRATIVGSLIGAVVGHHVGQVHHARGPSTVVGGSMIGAAIGNSIGAGKASRRGEYRDVGYETVQRCEVNYRDQWAEQVDGYRVTYIYQGREYTTRMPYDPGARLRVDVNIRPVFDRRY